MSKATKKQSKPQPRWDRMAQTINAIIDQPKKWAQETWHSDCGTACCFAGFADVFDPDVKIPARPRRNSSVSKIDAWHTFKEATSRRAQVWYGLDNEQADWLFDGSREFADLYVFVLTKGLMMEAYETSQKGIKKYPKLDT